MALAHSLSNLCSHVIPGMCRRMAPAKCSEGRPCLSWPRRHPERHGVSVKGKPVCAAGALAGEKKEVVPSGRASPVSTPEVEALLDSLKWDASGYVVAIAQHVDTGAVLMQGFADRNALSATLASGRATFFSRSRRCLWTKGETSGNFIDVVDVFVDCDRDSVIYLGKPDGPTCHTGAETCYYSRLTTAASANTQTSVATAVPTFSGLEATIQQRKAEAEAARVGLVTEDAGRKPSWTRRLIDNPTLLCSKIREEAGELCETWEKQEGKERAASEMADVLFHSMVLLSLHGVTLEDVGAVLRSRFNVSGVEEKASRKAK